MELRSLINRPEVKTFGIPVGTLFVGLILLFFVAVPGFSRVLDRQNKISKEQARLQVMVDKTNKLSDFASQADTLKKDFELFNRAIPTDSAIPELLAEIQTISNENGEKITALQFSGLEKSTSVPLEIHLRYVSQGSLANLQDLLKATETASRLIDAGSLRFNQRFDETTKTTVYSPELDLVSFYTQEPTLQPDSPLTFSFSNPTYISASQILQALKQY